MMTKEEMLEDTGIDEIVWWMQRWEEAFSEHTSGELGFGVKTCLWLIPAWIVWAPDNSQLLISAIVEGKIDVRALNAVLVMARRSRDKAFVRAMARSVKEDKKADESNPE
jgi:hypothetical protein